MNVNLYTQIRKPYLTLRGVPVAECRTNYHLPQDFINQMFFCIPILVGCQVKIRPKGETVVGRCPRCRNMSVIPAKKTTWFEFCWVPLIPVYRERLWVCHICPWQTKRLKGETSNTSRGGPAADLPLEEFVAPVMPGYQPAYIQNPIHFPANVNAKT